MLYPVKNGILKNNRERMSDFILDEELLCFCVVNKQLCVLFIGKI